MRQQETASHYSVGRPPLIPTNPLSIFPSLATEAAKKSHDLILNCLGPIHGQSTRNRFGHFHWAQLCILLRGSQKRKSFIGSRRLTFQLIRSSKDSLCDYRQQFSFRPLYCALWRFVSIKQMCVIVMIRMIREMCVSEFVD